VVFYIKGKERWRVAIDDAVKALASSLRSLTYASEFRPLAVNQRDTSAGIFFPGIQT
jgi:hypothetical protein